MSVCVMKCHDCTRNNDTVNTFLKDAFVCSSTKRVGGEQRVGGGEGGGVSR